MKWIRYTRIIPAALLLALSLIATANARIITVDDDGPADFNNVQAAIDDADDGDTVEIQPGTYTGPGNYNIRYNGKAITVRGTEPEDFDIVAATVIDCNSQGRGFIFESNEGTNSVLTGLTITRAYCTYHHDSFGGAVGCNNSSPIISRCIIEDNNGWLGGGIGAGYGQVTIRDCIIRGNTGGGIFVTSAETLTIENCIITGNTSSNSGGGIRSSAILQTIKNCLFVANRTELEGGAIACKRGDVIISNCTITGNAAESSGGAIRTRLYNYTTTVVNSIIYDNYAPLGSEIAFDDAGLDSRIDISWCDLHGGRSDVFPEPNEILDWGAGNIDIDPCFAAPGYWGHLADPNIRVEPNDPNALWVDSGGDYHLKSQGGRWDATTPGWAIDEVTSLCIDAGDPNYPLGLEPFPNGGRINMGAYGGTPEASKSYFGRPPCTTIVAGDINGDCMVDGKDFALLGRNWLISDPQPPNPALPGRATNPDPANGAVDLPVPSGRGGPTFALTWQAGARAESHDVYFGTTSPGEFQGNQAETEFVPNFGLTSGPYYWRIDEINSHGKTTGAVWTFSFLPPSPAANPFPPDGSINISPNALLSWTPGGGATSHNIYLGTESPGTLQGNRTDPMFSPGSLLPETEYYWRIDEVGPGGTTEGPVWSFTTGTGITR